MEAQFTPTSSFIPKKGAGISTDEKKEKGKTRSILSVIGWFIFVTSLVVAGGAFAYEKILVSFLESSKNKLAEAQSAFDPEVIRELEALDKRLDTAGKILMDHTTVTPFFDLMESNTLRNVRFSSFSFFQREEDEVSVELSGIARGYEAVALQSDVFFQNPNLKDVRFSGFGLDEFGNVNFVVLLSVKKSLLSYTPEISASEL